MTLDQLRYFKRLAELLNYTQAAADLFISQPALSSAISRLESEIGAKLLVRSRSGKASLTQAGESFYEHVCLALADIDAGIELAREAEYGAKNALLRVGVIPCMQSKAWSRALNEFRAESPLEPTFMIRQAHSHELTSQLLQGELDVAFASKVGEDSRINYRLCGLQPTVLCVNKQHAWAKRKSISLKELEGRTVMTYETSNAAYGAVKQALEGYDIDVQESFFDEMTMASMVQADPQTMAVFSYSLVVKVFPGLAFIPFEEVPTDAYHKVYFAYLKASQRAVASAFIDYALRYLDTHEIRPHGDLSG
ncbi:MAG: LysR family transcriptional regulator [Coriobacteriia bacterium]|nr:LysR family transcriptional regulator [Coriobacteriia bacterium]